MQVGEDGDTLDLMQTITVRANPVLNLCRSCALSGTKLLTKSFSFGPPRTHTHAQDFASALKEAKLDSADLKMKLGLAQTKIDEQEARMDR